LHGRDDIQHIGALSDLLFVQKIKIVEACAADQNTDFLSFQVFEVRQDFRAFSSQFYAIVDKDKAPKFVPSISMAFFVLRTGAGQASPQQSDLSDIPR
jgi:hypothetical protein